MIDSQKRVIKYQHDLKEKLLQKENTRILKRIEKETPFLSVKQLDAEFVLEHDYLINNIRRVKNNKNAGIVYLENSVKLPLLQCYNGVIK